MTNIPICYHILLTLGSVALAFLSTVCLYSPFNNTVIFLANDEHFNIGLHCLIALSLGIIIIPLLGYIGQQNDSRRILLMYVGVLFIFISAQTFVGGLILKFNDNLYHSLTLVVNRAFMRKHHDTIEIIQEMFECCGYKSADYWQEIPQSCCSTGTKCTSSTAYQIGCAEAITLGFGKTIGIMAIVLGTLELVVYLAYAACCFLMFRTSSETYREFWE